MTRIHAVLPAGLVCTKRTTLFTKGTVPEGLLCAHSIKAGVWGLLRVVRGRVRYCLDTEPGDWLVVAEGGTVMIEPEAPHHVELLDEHSTFFVEFHKVETGA
jgi:tellurite resistance-related uncharacterized protein